MKRVKNKEDGTLDPFNFVTEYCFKEINEEDYWKWFSHLDDKQRKKFSYFEKIIRLAINKGLTYDMSTNGGEKAEEIWREVEDELNILGE